MTAQSRRGTTAPYHQQHGVIINGAPAAVSASGVAAELTSMRNWYAG